MVGNMGVGDVPNLGVIKLSAHAHLLSVYSNRDHQPEINFKLEAADDSPTHNCGVGSSLTAEALPIWSNRDTLSMSRKGSERSFDGFTRMRPSKYQPNGNYADFAAILNLCSCLICDI